MIFWSIWREKSKSFRWRWISSWETTISSRKFIFGIPRRFAHPILMWLSVWIVRILDVCSHLSDASCASIILTTIYNITFPFRKNQTQESHLTFDLISACKRSSSNHRHYNHVHNVEECRMSYATHQNENWDSSIGLESWADLCYPLGCPWTPLVQGGKENYMIFFYIHMYIRDDVNR